MSSWFDAVAIPEARARMLSARRSPRRIALAGPRTVARWALVLPSSGIGREWPSEKYHSIVQPSCVKTSLKKGTPARMP